MSVGAVYGATSRSARRGWPERVSFLRRTVRAVRILVRDDRIPRPLKWLAALGLLPVPGPFDEAVLLFVAAALVAFRRDVMRDAWRAAAR
jgi:hypothetical protein